MLAFEVTNCHEAASCGEAHASSRRRTTEHCFESETGEQTPNAK